MQAGAGRTHRSRGRRQSRAQIENEDVEQLAILAEQCELLHEQEDHTQNACGGTDKSCMPLKQQEETADKEVSAGTQVDLATLQFLLDLQQSNQS